MDKHLRIDKVVEFTMRQEIDRNTDIKSAIGKLDALRAGQSVATGFLIERTISNFEDSIRYELPEIEKEIVA